jgi:ssDNA-binding Zn-finger/Zn-ribbon topoisomerase 1
MRFCENYYGEPYADKRFDVMSAYLDGKSERFFDAAANVLVKRFSRANRISPGPAEIEKYLNEILDLLPEPIALPDPRERISDEERERVGEMIHRLAEKLRFGVSKICPNCQKTFKAHGDQKYCLECNPQKVVI